MAKSSNPVDAHRKAQRKQELKKNKQTRVKQKEVQVVKKDTRPIEADIKRLSSKGNLSKQEKDDLSSLRAELASVRKAKEEYVEAHPEHRKFVFPDRPGQNEQGGVGGGEQEPPGLYDRTGKLKHPERSMYYDAVYNPFGVPPPGMPYREKPEYEAARLGLPTPEQMAAFHQQLEAANAAAEAEGSDSDDDSDEDDDDIAMPSGRPPGIDAGSNSDSDSDDDIAMPAGPPPPKPSLPPPTGPSSSRIAIPRPSRPFQPPQHPHPHQPQPYRPQPLPSRPNIPPPPAPPPNAPSGPRQPHPPPHPSALPSRPPPPGAHMSDPLNAGGAAPQRAFQQGVPQPPPSSLPARPPTGAPPLGAVISSSPVPPQQQQQQQHPDASVSAAPSPFLPLPGLSTTTAAPSATISAAPVLRDLKKEATAFVPSNMRRKMAQQKGKLAKVGLGVVHAAPSSSAAAAVGGGEGEGGEGGGGGGGGAGGSGVGEKRKTLAETMAERGIGGGGVLGVAGPRIPPGGIRPPPSAAAGEGKKAAPLRMDSDYKRFEEEMKDFL